MKRAPLGAAILLAGALLAACNSTPFPVGGAGPVVGAHWHAALGVYDCDHWMHDFSGDGVWLWPAATPAGAPARVARPNVYAGLHSHDDGVIHIEPAYPDEVGARATLGLYFEFGGWELGPDGFTFLAATRQHGDACGAGPGDLHWSVRGTEGSGDPAEHRLHDGEVIVIAFVPSGVSVESLGDPPSVERLPARIP